MFYLTVQIPVQGQKSKLYDNKVKLQQAQGKHNNSKLNIKYHLLDIKIQRDNFRIVKLKSVPDRSWRSLTQRIKKNSQEYKYDTDRYKQESPQNKHQNYKEEYDNKRNNKNPQNGKYIQYDRAQDKQYQQRQNGFWGGLQSSFKLNDNNEEVRQFKNSLTDDNGYLQKNRDFNSEEEAAEVFSDWELSFDGEKSDDIFDQRNRKKYKIRDPWLNPVPDVQSISDLINTNPKKVEQRLIKEKLYNEWETREAIKFVAIYLVVIPLVCGFMFSRTVGSSFLNQVTLYNPEAFAMKQKQKVIAAKELHSEELRLKMSTAIGRLPQLSEKDVIVHLREEALELKEKEEHKNKQGFVNLISDSVSAVVFFTSFLRHSFGRLVMYRTIDRFVSGFSETGKAFLIILFADILLGYHSEEGWASAINLFANHYGYEVEEEPVYVFIATVPVLLDSLFKYWIFIVLNRRSPSSAVTLREMDRH